MPSEKIYGSDGVDVRVAWGSNEEGVVQVATLHKDGLVKDVASEATDNLIAIVNEWLTAAGEPAIDMVKVRAALPYVPHFDGWHATLNDWASVNALIKVLKRARDKQFGTPE